MMSLCYIGLVVSFRKPRAPPLPNFGLAQKITKIFVTVQHSPTHRYGWVLDTSNPGRHRQEKDPTKLLHRPSRSAHGLLRHSLISETEECLNSVSVLNREDPRKPSHTEVLRKTRWMERFHVRPDIQRGSTQDKREVLCKTRQTLRDFHWRLCDYQTNGYDDVLAICKFSICLCCQSFVMTVIRYFGCGYATKTAINKACSGSVRILIQSTTLIPDRKSLYFHLVRIKIIPKAIGNRKRGCA